MISTSVLMLLMLCSLFFLVLATGTGSSAADRKRSFPTWMTIFPFPLTPDQVCPSPLSEEEMQEMWSELMEKQRQFHAFRLHMQQNPADEAGVLLKYARLWVINRGFFHSIALQTLSTFADFRYQPGFLYHYVSSASALSSAPDALVSAGIFYDADKHYPNWYRYMRFNQTMARFAPRGMRDNVTQEVHVKDYGAMSRDYAHSFSHHNPDPFTQAQPYNFQRQNQQGELSQARFSGPWESAVKNTDVYYDCTHGDRWLWTVTYPAVEILPRYTSWIHLQKPRYVAALTADLDVEKLMAGLSPEVTGSHNMLDVSRDCPGPLPPNPASQQPLPSSYFRTLYPQSRLALRLAHSLSAFLQTIDVVTTELDYENNGITYGPYQPIPDTPSGRILADPPMNDSLLEAEVLANLMADSTIQASGIFFQVQQVIGSDGQPIPTPKKAFQAWRGAQGLVVGDLSASEDPNPELTAKLLEVWQNVAPADPRLRTFPFHADIRSSMDGGGLSPLAVDPLQYRAVSLNEGLWSSPHYRCDHYVTGWTITYAAPFFGPSLAEPGKLILQGVVTVDMALSD